MKRKKFILTAGCIGAGLAFNNFSFAGAVWKSDLTQMQSLFLVKN